MNRVQWKDFFREIKKNKGRFLSLLFIVALGCAFYSGIRSSEPDMTASADRYFDETNFCDIRLISTLGLTEDDVEEVSAIDGVEFCEGAYNVELFAVCPDKEPVMNIVSLGNDVNQFTVREGRLPENADECFVDVRYMNDQHCRIGDEITLVDTDKLPSDKLARDTFTIVGYGTWAWYLNLTRGTAGIGNGSVDAFLVLCPEVFTQDYYSTIFATVRGAKDVNSYTDYYDDIVDEVIDRIDNIADVQVKLRHDTLVEDGEKELADAREKIADAKQELNDALDELNDGEQKYDDGVKEFEDGKKKLSDGKKEYADGLARFEDGKKAYEDGLTAYGAGKSAYSSGRKAYEEGLKQFNAGKEQLEQAKKQLDEGKEAYETGKAAFDAGKKTLEEKEAELIAAESAIAAAKGELDSNKAALTAQKGELAFQKSELTAQKEDLQSTKGQLSELKMSLQAAGQSTAEVDAQIAAVDSGIAQINAGISQIDAGITEIDAGLSQIAAGYSEIESQQQVLSAGRAELNAGKAELASKEAELNAAKELLDQSEKQYLAGKTELDKNEAILKASEKKLGEAGRTLYMAGYQLEDAKKQVEDGEKELLDAKKEIENGERDLRKAKGELADARQKLDDGWNEYNDAKTEADEKIADAEVEIADGEKALEDLDEGKWYVLSRDTVQTVVEYGMDAERIGKIAKVFPVIFFLVAALVCLTTMTRMVEEERMLIGTMKALGYSKIAIISKYLFYAFSATIIGGVFGVLVGSKILPYVIMTAYGMLYTNVPYTLMPYNLTHCMTAIGLALLSTVGAAFAACYKELLSTPAALMRPPAPKVGKKIFLERIPGLWAKFSFSMKSTIRNLLRYKKRLIMTVLGIGGCMAILLVSYGLHDSIAAIVDNQYKNIWTYSASCSLDENLELERKEEICESLKDIPEVAESLLVRNISLDVTANDVTKTTYLYVVQDMDEMGDFVDLHDRVTHEKHELTEEGVILSEKLARMLGVQAGDEIELLVTDTNHQKVLVTDTAENYMFNYTYLSPSLYERVFEEAPSFNEVMIRYDHDMDEEQEKEVAERMLSEDGVTSVSLVRKLQESVDNMMNALNLVVWVLVIAAGLLVFVVTFNLNNINISERRRELASLKVLGFYDMDVAMYVYRENVFLTLFGIIAGIFMGTWLHRYLILTLEVEMIMFGRKIGIPSYIYSTLLTIVFSILVNLMMYYKLKQIDMVESLKSVE